ncbi:dTDP-4-dehydrorhamnose 3,5-epimerase family protein, partial [Acinetobacter baumannii]
LHFQHGPAAQAKLIRVLRGAIYDVFLDLRPNSPTYRQWGAIELKCEELRLLYIPKGFAHGFCTLRDDTEVSYRLSNYYAPEAEGGVLW